MSKNQKIFGTKIIAHRGYCPKNEPDNSFAAFKNAFDSESDGIEFDVQLSSDGKFICYHDDTLEDIGISENIGDLSFEEVTFSTLADGSTIPSLEEVLNLYANKFLLNIELKTPENGVNELVDQINFFDLEKTPENLIISSFHPEQLKRIKKIDPKIPTGLLVSFSRNQVKRAIKYGCNALHPFYNEISEEDTKVPRFLINPILKFYAHKSFVEAKNNNILINPYTVNEKQYLYECFRKNVFSVITDELTLAQKIRKRIQ
ncbi:MAG: glycerophosphodiester phosphodiesterase [Candidatus Hodarchaeales archaeon]|jgi:glycerophosphoryl diester phosphodiesterase